MRDNPHQVDQDPGHQPFAGGRPLFAGDQDRPVPGEHTPEREGPGGSLLEGGVHEAGERCEAALRGELLLAARQGAQAEAARGPGEQAQRDLSQHGDGAEEVRDVRNSERKSSVLAAVTGRTGMACLATS